MPRVDFYILPAAGDREKFTCDIANKIHQQELQLYIHTSSRDAASMLDDLLWTWKDTGFLPHSLADADDADTSSVTIGWGEIQAKHREVLINLGNSIPESVEDFDRVVEIVAPNGPHRQQARDRYKQYRQAGFELQDHKLR